MSLAIFVGMVMNLMATGVSHVVTSIAITPRYHTVLHPKGLPPHVCQGNGRPVHVEASGPALRITCSNGFKEFVMP
jgi:hypothetical protein